MLVGCDQLGLLSNQITELFNHQNLLKESTDILVFYGVCHQGKMASETSFFLGGLASYSSFPIRLQDSLIINISGNDQVISLFFCMEIDIKGS